MLYASEFKTEVWQGCVVTKDPGGWGEDSGYMIRCDSNGIVNFNLGNGSWHEINTSENTVQANTWHNVATTYDGNLMKIYVDGVESAVSDPLNITIMHSVGDENLFFICPP